MYWKDGVFTQVTVIQDGVETNLQPSREIKHAIELANIVSTETTGKVITITSLLDGRHSIKSKHYTGNAFDIRISKYTPFELKALVKALKIALGTNYDVILEKDHIHIEYDPKN